MNILFALYGDFRSNSANPLALYARELQSYGHSCVIAVPANLQETIGLYEERAFVPALYADVLAAPDSFFPDGRPADVIHACTPRESVRHFVTTYMALRPTPLVIYLEDNERWIALRELGLREESLREHSDVDIARRLPDALSHPLRYEGFIRLADAVAVIQDKLKSEVPTSVPCETIMLGVDLKFYSPRHADPRWRKQYGVADGERVIVYHGGVDQFKMSAIKNLCRAVDIINKRGYRCRLLRTGVRPLDFLDTFAPDSRSMISDLGFLPRAELPNVLSLAEVFVQPGEPDPFEDLRLPGKVPEFLAMGRPVIMPAANIGHLFTDGVNAVLLQTGSADEIAVKCLALFTDPEKADAIGRAGRLFAEQYFDVRCQAKRLEELYRTACRTFDPRICAKVWQLEKKVDDLRSMVVERDAVISTIMTSRSWKITRPLRVISRLAKAAHSSLSSFK